MSLHELLKKMLHWNGDMKEFNALSKECLLRINRLSRALKLINWHHLAMDNKMVSMTEEKPKKARKKIPKKTR